MGFKISEKEHVMKGKIEWYDHYLLDYDEDDFIDAINELNLNVGDDIEIVIRKKDIHL